MLAALAFVLVREIDHTIEAAIARHNIPGAVYHLERDGKVYEKARAADAPYGLVNEWHGPARAIVSVVGNKIYFPVGSQVICLEGK